MQKYLKTAALVLFVVTGLLASVGRAEAKPAEQPNIIFIMADDLGWKDVGFMGAEFFETPHIDKLAAQGMSFKAAYTGGANCSPTRACLMTGTYTPRHRIYTPGGSSKGKPEYMRLLVPARERKDKALNAQAAKQFEITNDLAPSFTCIPELLGPAGYRTARLGKWHLGEDTQGFDLSSSNGKGGPGGKFYGNVDVAEQLTDRAVQFMEDNREGPFFLYLSHWDVHTPIRARKAVVQRYKDKLVKLPEDQRKNFNPTYAAMIEAVDQSVRRVAAKVDELGIAENTLIVFISDNGACRVSPSLPRCGVPRVRCSRRACVCRWWHAGLGRSRPARRVRHRSLRLISCRRLCVWRGASFPRNSRSMAWISRR